MKNPGYTYRGHPRKTELKDAWSTKQVRNIAEVLDRWEVPVSDPLI